MRGLGRGLFSGYLTHLLIGATTFKLSADYASRSSLQYLNFIGAFTVLNTILLGFTYQAYEKLYHLANPDLVPKNYQERIKKNGNVINLNKNYLRSLRMVNFGAFHIPALMMYGSAMYIHNYLDNTLLYIGSLVGSFIGF